MTIQKVYQHFKISGLSGPLTVEIYLKQHLHFSSRKIQKLTRARGIFVNQKVTFLKRELKENDLLKILILQDKTYGAIPEKGAVNILYEDESMIVLYKSPFQIVHPAGNTENQTLANYLAYHFQQKNLIYTIRPVHRLDRDTSGCIAFAKSAEAQTLLEQQLRSGQLKRRYLAVVQGKLNSDQGTIREPIGKDPKSPNRRIIDPNGSSAVTHYRVRAVGTNASLLEVALDTGRTHQIRVHLANLGHPILGDRMYGLPAEAISRQALHASSLNFHHLVTSESVTLSAPLPQDMQQLLQTESIEIAAEYT